MSYIAGNSSATVNENMSDLYIFNSAEGSSYENQPYAKILTMNGGAAVTYTGVTLSSGGTATIAANTLMRDVHIYSGASAVLGGGANFNGLTIENGGSAIKNGNGLVFSNFTIKAGGYLFTQNANFYGRNNSVAAGTLAGYLSVASDSVDGVIYGVTQTNGAYRYGDIVFSNFVNNGGYTYLKAGGSMLNGSAIKAGAGFAFEGNAYLYNVKVTNGYVWMHTAGVAVSLGGAETQIKKGNWYQNTCAGTGTPDTNLYAADGVLYGVTIKNSGNWLRNLTIVSGLTISAPVVSSGGTLKVGPSGYGTNITVQKNGTLWISGTAASAANVDIAGTAVISGSVVVSGAVIRNGGSMSMANTGATYRNGLVIESGGKAYLRACTISGTIDIKANTLDGNLRVASDSVDGVAYGFTQTAGAHNYYAGAVVSGYINNGACYTYVGAGGEVAYGSALKNNGGFGFLNSGYLKNVWISGGSLWTQHNAGAACSLGGAETYIKQGQVYHCAAAGSANNDPDMYAENGALYGVKLVSSGTWLKNLTILEGLTISAPVVSSGGTLAIGSGGIGANLDVKVNGRVYVRADGVVNGINVSTGQVNAGHVYVSSGAVVNDLNIYGDKNSGQYDVVVSGGAVVSRVYHSGGGLWVYGDASVKEIELVAGETVFQDSSYASDVTVSKTAYLYVRNNALVENLHMSGANARFDKGTIRNATFVGNVGQLRMVDGLLMESAVISSGARLHVSGGVLNSAVVNSGGGLTVSNGGKASNVTVYGIGAASGVMNIMAGGYASGVFLSGTVGESNYISMYAGEGGVLEDFTTDKGGVYLAGGGLLSNFSQRNGALVILRGEVPFASSGTVSGGTLYFQNGAKGADIVVKGGNMQIHNAGNQSVPGSGARVSGVDLVTGNIYVSAGGELFDVRVSGGYVFVHSNANYGRPCVSGALITGGQVKASSGGAVFDATVNAGRLWGLKGGTISGATLNGGELFIMDSNTASETALTNRAAIIASDVDVNGGQIFWRGSNASGADIRISGGGTHYIQNAAHVSGMAMYAGVMNLEVNGGAHPNDTPKNPVLEDFLMAGGKVNANNYARINDMSMTGGTLDVNNGAVVTDIAVAGADAIANASGGTINNVAIAEGAVNVRSNGVVNTVEVAGGKLMVYGGGTANDVTISENGSAVVSGVVNVNSDATAWNVQVNNGGTANVTSGGLINAKTNTGAHINFTENKSFATFAGDDTDIAEGTLYFNGSAVAGHATDGVLEGFNAGGATVGYKLSIGSGIVLKDAVGNNTAVRVSAFDGAVVSGMTLRGGAIICANNNNVSILDTTLTGDSTTCNLNLSAGAYASNTVVQKGGKIQFQHADAKAENTTIMAGGSMVMTTAADTGKLVTLDFTGTTGNQTVYITDLGNVKASTEIVLKGETAGNTYTIATSGSTMKYVNCGEWGLYDDSIKAGESITNAFTGMTYDFNATGTAIAVSAFAAAAQETAGSIESGTDINGNGKAAKWTQNTTATGTIKAATSAIAGDAWLELDGANLAGTTLFGAEVGFGNAVNIYATNDAVIGNLAAGATSSGTVQAVKLTVDSATVGQAYAGGFGNVTGATETLIGEGAKMQKDFYAGALANYKNTGVATSAGDITLDIEAGEFSGNIYGAASVKAGAATSVVHSVGNVTIDVTGGETKKGNQACLFAGGLATGSVASDNAVYTVTSVSTTIDGGTWTATEGNTACGGRGVFGGIFASQVTAEAGDVSLTVNGGTFGNIYGGGWAQKGGNSIVGDVTISITGGTVANVFGGGSTSSSGGATYADDVTITVSGGTISGAIYARGQSSTDSVTGTATVNFTGANDFDCDVYGYSYVGSTENDATLTFNGYTGTFSGKVGGFSTIAFNDGAQATFADTAEIVNGAWEFDLSARDAALSDTSLLSWGAESAFSGDTVKVTFADATQAAAGWSIADAAFAGATFDLWIGTDKIAEGVSYDTAVGGETAWANWKFTSVGGTLKFAEIA